MLPSSQLTPCHSTARGALRAVFITTVTASLISLAAPARAAREGPFVHEAISVQGSCVDRQRLAEQIVSFGGHERLPRGVTITVQGDPLADAGATVRLRRGGEIVGERHFERVDGTCQKA